MGYKCGTNKPFNIAVLLFPNMSIDQILQLECLGFLFFGARSSGTLCSWEKKALT